MCVCVCAGVRVCVCVCVCAGCQLAVHVLLTAKGDMAKQEVQYSQRHQADSTCPWCAEDDCSSDRCENQAVCVPSASGASGFHCDCQPGYRPPNSNCRHGE